jgi:hypothetical protein
LIHNFYRGKNWTKNICYFGILKKHCQKRTIGLIWSPWGWCFDNDFLRFLTIFSEKIGIKNNVTITFSKTSSRFIQKHQFFGETIFLKFIASVPGILESYFGNDSTRHIFQVVASKNWDSVLDCRVARFFLTQNTKTVKNLPNYHNITKWTQSVPNGRKMDQVSTKYANIFYSKTLQNLPKFGFLVWKYIIWQPLRPSSKARDDKLSALPLTSIKNGYAQYNIYLIPPFHSNSKIGNHNIGPCRSYFKTEFLLLQ